MSKIQRYSVTHNVVDEEDCGEWVLYDDHIAEVVHLRGEADALQARIDELEAFKKKMLTPDGACWMEQQIKAEGIEEMLEACEQFEYNTETGNYDLQTGKIDVDDAKDYIDKLRGQE